METNMSSRKSRYRKRTAATAVKLAFTLAIGVLGASAAHAGDLCIDYQGVGGTHTIVGKNLKVPKAGKCALLAGFSTYQGSTRTVTGPVCASSDGKHMTFGLTGVSGNMALYYSIDLPLPLLNGVPGAISVFTNTGAMQLVSSPTAGPCPSPQPVP
jgi:hypothetical protein